MIRDYPRLKKEYEALHVPSISVCSSGLPTGKGSTSNPVEQVALKELPGVQQKEFEAVQAAVTATQRMYGGDLRIKLIELVFWKQTHTIEGAAFKLHISDSTARRWHKAFIYLVAEKYGFFKK